ncbi:MAG TPA: tetratricopeptide repeat protein [Polyangiaceae bacterium]|nr:tetratricopeptide repeat protein [Polyangiaceae bacterium]
MGPPRAAVEPTVLLVGAGERLTPAFQAALSRYQVQVETTELSAVMDAVIVTAPDLVLLMGEAAKDGGMSVLQRLAGLSKNFTVPVVVLSDEAELDAKLSAFRHGATAVLPRSASIDRTAEQVARMARDIPEHGTDSQGGLGDATLDEFIAVLSKELRAGLSDTFSAAGADAPDLKLTLGRGRPLTEFLDSFVRRVRRHVVRAEPLEYELSGLHGAEALGGTRPSLPAAAPDIASLRVVVADDDTPRADAVAQELRGRGVTVVVTDLEPSPTRLQTLRQADPTVFIIGEEHDHDAGYDLLRRLRRDARLRWASLLVVRWEEIWSEERGAPALGRLESTLAGLAEPERALLARAEARVPFDTRLETTGPARLLRTLEKSERPLRVRVENPRVELTLDISDGLVVGAEGRTLEFEPKPLSGVNALSALLVLGSGRVRIEPVDQPASANVMTPVEAALAMADAETPPITPSVPAAGTVSLHPPRPVEPASAPVPSIRPTPIVAIAAPAAAPRPAVAPGPPSRPLAPRPGALPQASAPKPPQRSAPTPPGPFVAPRLPVPAAALAAPAVHVPPAIAFDATAAASLTPAQLPPVATSTPPHERNPPAMTLSATEPLPRAVPPSPPASPANRGRARWQTFAARCAAQDAKLHGKRISFGMTAVLVGLGALQGLAIVTIYAGARWLARPRIALESAALARDGVSERKASAFSAASVAAPPAPLASVVAPPPPHSAGSADGSAQSVPDCKGLLGESPPHAGFYPGAALQEMRRGRAAIVHGDLGAARSALCRAASYNQKSAQIALELARVLLLERDGAAAEPWARRAVALEPNNAPAQDALGDALAQLGANEEAKQAFIRGARLDAQNEAGLHALLTRAMKQGDQALRHGDLITAERGFRRATVLEPRSSSAASGLSYVLVQLGDVKSGVEWARRAVELAPRSSGAHLALGDALAKSGDKPSAGNEWREAALLDPGNREAQKRLRAAGLPPP